MNESYASARPQQHSGYDALRAPAAPGTPKPDALDTALAADRAANLGQSAKFASAEVSPDGSSVRYETSHGYAEANSANPSAVEPGGTAPPNEGRAITRAFDPHSGAPVAPADMQPTTIVNVAGIGDMALSSAIEAGFVNDPRIHGIAPPRAAPPAPQAQAQAPQQQQAPAKPAETTENTTEADTGADAAALVDHIEASTSVDLKAAAVDEMADSGELSEGTINTIAESLGMTPEAAQTMVSNNLVPAYQNEADAAIGRGLGGVSDPAFIAAAAEWIGQNNRERLGDAVREQVMSRSTRGYEELAAEYISELDTINPDAILNADLGPSIANVAKNYQGKIIITTVDGQSVDWRGALSLGLVKFGG